MGIKGGRVDEKYAFLHSTKRVVFRLAVWRKEGSGRGGRMIGMLEWLWRTWILFHIMDG